eukprot:GGOE01032707.1.p1 GENE.GGOE01032707.1~~GGOE01032707.1.p1  ORF type:complete len:1109 (-),score=352.96 GGOE01032707.1:1408-4701(-)
MQPLYLLWGLLLCSRATWGDVIVGAGTTLPTPVYTDAQFAYCFVNRDVELQFYASESQAGICRIESAADECDPSDTRAPSNLDFAASTAILNQSDYDKYPDLQMYPVLATAIVPVYNLKGVQSLVLSKTALAQIFSGQITTWDDSRITANNPNFSHWNIPANQKIQVVVRQESSDITMVFKSAMSAFSTSFVNYVDVSPSPTWGNLNFTKVEGYEAVNSYLLLNSWTISYSVLKYAIDANLPRALILKGSNIIVEASLKSTTFAVLEMGLDFGNNGDNESRLTADLNNARGVNAWPIATYTYVVLRKSTLRAGATCDTVRQTVAFWQWFLTADVIQSLAESHYFAQPPKVVRDIVVGRLVSDVTCLGQLVFQAVTSQVMAMGETSVAGVLQALQEVYATIDPQMALQYTEGTLNTSSAVAAALTTNHFVAVRQRSLAPAKGAETLLFAGVALVVITQYDLVLNLATLVRILEGNITTWLHPDLVALNPNGILDSTGNAITDPSQRIILLNGPTSVSVGFQALMRAYSPGFVGKALKAAYQLHTEEQLQIVVAGMAYTLSVTMSSTESSSRTKFASLQRPEGVAVSPTPQSILACASSAKYTAAAGLDLGTSSDSSCYPLSDVVYLIVRMPECSNVSDDSVDAEAVEFLAWAFGDNSTAAAMEGQGLALLTNVSPAIRAANAQALAALSCTSTAATDTSSSNIVPIVVGACVGAFFFIAIPVAWYVWKSTRDMRALRKQFSDVKVAEECAEAIACFDLEAVSWLAGLTKPSKIQLAFLHIVNLLVEVKPFIPDQLLAQLQAAKRGEDLPKPEEKQHRRSRRDTAGDDQTVATSQSQSSLRSSLNSGRSVFVRNDSSKAPGTVNSEGSSGPRRGRGVRGGSSNPNTLPGHQAVDRYRRTCTYMYVRFVLTSGWEADHLGQVATTVAAHVVTLAKAHGATIDKVTYDTVALHWNVSGQSAGAPLKATALAMELACIAQILPPEVQGNLRLLVGIGHGRCTIATVSAAGQRFFVVGGVEVSNAVEAVMREVAVPLDCSVLLSASVQQEIKYGFRCSPRLWYRDVLFWEPVEQRNGCKLDDEWMYQIQRMKTTTPPWTSAAP